MEGFNLKKLNTIKVKEEGQIIKSQTVAWKTLMKM
jgi:hypothetical protein